MEIVANIFSNLTMFLVAQTIFVQQDFRTISCVFEETQSELLNKILQIASNSLKPVSHSVLGKINIKRSRFAGPTLNVVVLDNIIISNNISLVRENIFSDDVTIIMLNENKDINFERWMTLSGKVFILTKSHLICLNSFENGKIIEIDFSDFNPIRTQKSIQNYLSSTQTLRHDRNLTIFFQYSPPKSAVTPIEKRFVFIGPDGSLANSLVKSLVSSLNVKPTFCTDIGLTYPNYEKWLDDPVVAPRMHYQFFYTKVLTNNVVTIFNKSVTDSIHLHLSPFLMKETLMEDKMQLKTESLYPHHTDCLVIMVPKQSTLEPFLQKIIKNSDIQSICIALTLFTIVRMIMERPSWKQSINIFIKTLGIFFNQDQQIRNEYEVEVAWYINLRGFSAFATITMSVIIYKNLISKKYVEIDTIEDLIESNLTIFAPEFLRNDDIFWSNLKPILQEKINFKQINDINYEIVRERKFNYAYIFTDSAAEYMEMILHAYTTGTNYKRTVRIMNEKLHCRLSSYRILKNSQLKGYVNSFIRRFVENGLYDRHLEWIRRLNRDVFQVNKYLNKQKRRNNVILNVDMVFDIFILYIVGIAASIIIFVFEIKI